MNRREGQSERSPEADAGAAALEALLAEAALKASTWAASRFGTWLQWAGMSREDLQQDVWLKLHRADRQSDDRDLIFKLAFTIANRRMITIGRQKGRRGSTTPIDNVEPATTEAPAPPASETPARIRDAMHHLTPRQYEALTLYLEFSMHPMREVQWSVIGEQLGVTEGRAQTLVSEARMRIRASLGRDAPERVEGKGRA